MTYGSSLSKIEFPAKLALSLYALRTASNRSSAGSWPIDLCLKCCATKNGSPEPASFSALSNMIWIRVRLGVLLSGFSISVTCGRSHRNAKVQKFPLLMCWTLKRPCKITKAIASAFTSTPWASAQLHAALSLCRNEWSLHCRAPHSLLQCRIPSKIMT